MNLRVDWGYVGRLGKLSPSISVLFYSFSLCPFSAHLCRFVKSSGDIANLRFVLCPTDFLLTVLCASSIRSIASRLPLNFPIIVIALILSHCYLRCCMVSVSHSLPSFCFPNTLRICIQQRKLSYTFFFAKTEHCDT